MSYTDSWMEVEKQLGGRPVLPRSPEQIRAMVDATAQMLLPLMPPPSENVVSEDGEIDGVKYRVYKPKGSSGGLPVAIYAHGGGWMTGDLNSEDLLCRGVSENNQSVVVSIDYSLAPEHKWPTQLNECMKVYKWTHQHAASVGGDADKFYTIGGSAGAGLALQLANQVLKDPQLKHSLKGIIAMFPVSAHWDTIPVEYHAMYKAYTDNARDTPMLDKESMETFYHHLGVDPKDPDFFVLLAADNHKNFPPTYFVSAQYDPLRDDAYVLEAALKKAGVSTKHDHYQGLPHYFHIFPQLPESEQMVRNLISGIEWMKSRI